MLTLIAVHVVIGVFAPALVRPLRAGAFLVMALAPLASGIWLLAMAPTVLSGGVIVERYAWIPAFGVELSFRLGLLQWVLAMIVTWVGTLVLAYCRWYFGPGEQARTAMLLTIFAGTMVGLVTSDDLVMLYVFWELTSVLSYLLIGHDPTRRANRGAAHTALIVTTFGGLAMLLGIVGLGYRAGTLSLSAILAAPPTGTLVTASVLLMLVGALSKSALIPFHFWLPGAMAAPTPISAYLHAAAMVKAGVYLVAALAPVFATVPLWRPVLLVLGPATMIVGGWRALRQVDLKLLLAYGTVSQLGFMLLLVGVGTPAAAMAGIGVVVAHALFKSSLFLFVGVVDHHADTRDLTRLDGLGRRTPWLAALAGLAIMSMAGLPPTLGFIAKEGAFEAIAYLVGGDAGIVLRLPGIALAVAIVFASMLTLAYSLRWWWGAFGSKHTGEEQAWKRPPVAMASVPGALAILGLAGGFLGPQLTALIAPYAATVKTGSAGHGLALWHGFGWPLAMTGIAITGGVVLFLARHQIAAVQATFPRTPTAEGAYHASLRLLDRVAVGATARTQSGSLAAYLGIILITLTAMTLWAASAIPMWADARPFDTWGQLAIASVMVLAAFLATGARGRLRALLLAGVTGYGTALLFALHGAPDLALTQVLVETVSLLVFVLVLRRMPKFFTKRPLTSTKWWRALVAMAAGLVVTLVALAGLPARVAPPVSEAWPEAAYEFGYGKNVVNVALVDIRAWDTFGEISVLVIAAIGVASLIFLQSRVGGVTSTAEAMEARDDEMLPDSSPAVWLRAGQTLRPAARSLVFEVVVRILFWIMLVVSHDHGHRARERVGLDRRHLLHRTPHHHPGDAVPRRRADRTSRRHHASGRPGRPRDPRPIAGPVLLRARHEPGRHPAPERLHRQAGAAAGRCPGGDTAGLGRHGGWHRGQPPDAHGDGEGVEPRLLGCRARGCCAARRRWTARRCGRACIRLSGKL